MVLPPIPATVWSPLGPIPVHLVASLTDESGERLRGRWRPDPRVIEVEAGVGLVLQWQTLHHEWVHSVLDDHGIDLGVIEEIVVDTLATSLLASWLHHPPAQNPAIPDNRNHTQPAK
jgi:hypothetical protein